jgi:flagellar motility protein MotE (MotC chaperone)
MGKLLITIFISMLLINSLVIFGLLGYGAATGRFDNEKREQYLATWRGEKLVAPEPEEEIVEEKESPREASTRIAAIEEQSEIIKREILRDIELLRYMQTLVSEARRKLEKDREQLTKNTEIFQTKLDEHNRTINEEGFRKALKNYSSMKPKDVKADFMKMDEQDVVRYLSAMKPDVATAILGRFKTEEEQQKRQRLMKLLENYGTIKGDA